MVISTSAISSVPRPRRSLAAGLATALTGAALAVVPVLAAPATAAGEGLRINEVYVNGGSSGAAYTHKFVELFNPTSSPISLAGASIQYRPPSNSGGSSNVAALTGSIPAGGYFTIQGGSNGSNGQPVPGVDQVAGAINPGAGGGTITLAGVATAVDPSASTSVVDKIGWGTSNSPEGTAATGNSVLLSMQRNADSVDTNDNGADFRALAPTPDAASADGGDGGDGGGAPVEATIAEIQGTGPLSPLAGDNVTTEGVVTAAYPTGGFDGFFIQTGGPDSTPGASDGLFVFGPTFDESTLRIGDSVTVTGLVKEFGSLTEVDASTVVPIDPLPAVVANPTIPSTDCALPGTDCLTGAALDAAKEQVEGELFQPTGDYTVTDAYDGSAYNGGSASSSFFGEIGLAANSATPLITPTDVIDAQDTAAINARKAYNEAHRVILDDGSSTTYWNTGGTARDDLPLPWFAPDHTVRVGASVGFPAPVILDYRFGWKLQPQSQVVGAPDGKVTFEQDRPAAPEKVGGDLRLATFNVLNYFTTLGEDVPGCTGFNDRDGNPIAVNRCRDSSTPPQDLPNAPRGAWDEASFERQQAKIVAAINTMDADIVSVEEIENSSVVDGADRDEALANLVAALNAAAPGRWDYVRSPSVLPAGEDVIRTGFIYDPATVTPVGEAAMLTTSPAFDNAREPLAQVFRPAGAGADAIEFAVIVNHFKSKGSGTPDPDGQGNATVDRIAQAHALAGFARAFSAERGVDAVFLSGDFNSYSQEDPMQVLYGEGYVRLESDTEDEYSYSFDGMSGSLDHVLANPAALEMVEGVDIWEINANETVFNQYSRYNYNVTNLYSPGPFSASDHNPEVVGIDATTDPVLVTSHIGASHTPNVVQAGKTEATLRVTVHADDEPATGLVRVLVPDTAGGEVWLTAQLRDGKAKLRLPVFASAGDKRLTITYDGDDRVAGSTAEHVVEVVPRRGS
jgi:predicted extracellular nuclease